MMDKDELAASIRDVVMENRSQAMMIGAKFGFDWAWAMLTTTKSEFTEEYHVYLKAAMEEAIAKEIK